MPDAVLDGGMPVDPRIDVELLIGYGGKDDRLGEGNDPVPESERDPLVGLLTVVDEFVNE